MRPALTLCWQYLRAFIIIYLCLYAGNGIAALLPITIPGSIIGMLVLFLLLGMQLVPVKWVKPGCHLIIRYMALLFVPISVGVMSYTDILTAQFGPIVVSCIVSTVLVIVIVGMGSHRLHAERASQEDRHD